MAKHKVVSMPGDGIGNHVLPEAIRVLDAVGFEAEYVHADIGWECWIKEGNALPERTIELLRQYKVGLFGAITSKPKKEAEAELSPALRGKDYQYFSPIVSMRQILDRKSTRLNSASASFFGFEVMAPNRPTLYWRSSSMVRSGRALP